MEAKWIKEGDQFSLISIDLYRDNSGQLVSVAGRTIAVFRRVHKMERFTLSIGGKEIKGIKSIKYTDNTEWR